MTNRYSGPVQFTSLQLQIRQQRVISVQRRICFCGKQLAETEKNLRVPPTWYQYTYNISY